MTAGGAVPDTALVQTREGVGDITTEYKPPQEGAGSHSTVLKPTKTRKVALYYEV